MASLVTSPRARARITQKGGDARHRSCKSETGCWETHRHIQKAQRETKTRRVKKEKQNKNKKIANADRRRSNSAEGKATNIKKALKVSYASCRATYCSEEMTDKRGTTATSSGWPKVWFTRRVPGDASSTVAIRVGTFTVPSLYSRRRPAELQQAAVRLKKHMSLQPLVLKSSGKMITRCDSCSIS